MHFRIEHTFTGISLADYEKLHFDEAFNIALCEAVKLSRQLVSLDDDGTTLKRVVRVGPDREVPKPVQKVLKSDRIEYEERVTYKWGTMEGSWETIPSVLASKVVTKGRLGFREVSGGVLRWSEGDIQVKVLGVGGVIERFIVADVEKSYDQAAAFTQRYINEQA